MPQQTIIVLPGQSILEIQRKEPRAKVIMPMRAIARGIRSTGIIVWSADMRWLAHFAEVIASKGRIPESDLVTAFREHVNKWKDETGNPYLR